MKASILITTYNHENYIKQTLDSILMQKTDFDFEILIGEDDSKDLTREICKKYEKKYEGKIRLFLNDRKNVIYLNGKATGRWNFINLLNHAKGKFIARCEGDDFWTDERKLQKQIDFLEKNPDFAVCFHQVKWLKNGKFIREPNLPPKDKDFYEAEDLFLNDNFIRTCSVVYRKDLVRNIPRWFYTVPYGDVAMHLLFAQHGKIGYIPETLAVYRVNSGGIYSSENGFVNLVKSILTYTLVADKLGYFDRNSYKIGLSKLYYWAALEAVKMRELLLSSAHCLEPASHPQLIKRFQNFALISVIIPTFNRPRMLVDSIKSIISQTYQNFEIIVVNDGGMDVSRLVDNFKDPRFKYLAHHKNKGLAAARNTGILNASGQYIALLDDDDIFYPEHLETAVNVLSKEIPVIYTDAVRATYDKCGENYKLIKKNVPYSIDFDRNKLFLGNLSPVNCFVFEKSLALKAGLFDETFSTLEDWDFWIRLSSLTSFKHITKPTVQVNWRNDGTTMTSLLATEFKKNRQRIYDKYQDEINQIPNVKEILNEFQKIWAQDWQVESPTTSIIILTCNQLQYTKKCLESIFQNTQKPYELIIVDNGSTDRTVEFLEFEVLPNHADARIKIIKNNENKGFAGGNNQGMAAASGDYILLLNNDVVVTPGWLERMICCAEKRPEIGIVGPRSNYVSGPQLVERVDYDTHSLEGLTEFSKKFADDHAQQAQQVLRVVGFCMLIKRAVIDKIGGMDNRYGLGNFEDDDFSLRAAIAGFQSWIVRDSFVHHFGHRTFIGEKVDISKSLHKNWGLFKEKWGLPADKPYGSPYRLSEIKHTRFDPSVHYHPLGNEIAAIHKSNNDFKSAQTLYANIQANLCTKPLKEVLEDLQSFISSYPDFALAHNDLGVVYYHAGDKEKARQHYERAVELMPDNINFQKNLADFYCLELGRIEEALKIYVNILKSHPQDIETLMATGQICKALEKLDDARDFFSRVLEIEPWNVDARKQIEEMERRPLADISNSESAEDAYRRLQEKLNSLTPAEAIVEFEKLVELHPNFAIGHNDLGLLYYNTGNKEKALHHYQQAAQLQPENVTLQKNIADFLFVEQGRVEKALQIYVNILDTHPYDAETLLISGHICVALKRFEEAKGFYERVLALEPDNADANKNLQALLNRQSEESAARPDSLNPVTVINVQVEPRVLDTEESEKQDAEHLIDVSIVIGLDGIQNRAKQCIQSIEAHTIEPYELILIDNGATTRGLQKWAQNLVKDNAHYQLVKCDKTHSLAQCLNQAVKTAAGEHIVLMHNDVKVADHWLSSMLRCFRTGSATGVLGPMTNETFGIQKVYFSDNWDPNRLERDAKAFYEQNQYRRIPITQLTSFCLMFRRELIEKIGGFDAQLVSEQAVFADFCKRSAAWGFQNLVAGDVFVYHADRHNDNRKASSTAQVPAEDQKRLQENWNKTIGDQTLLKSIQMMSLLDTVNELYQKGYIDKAIETLLNAIGAIPEDKRLYLALAKISISMKRYQDARETLDEMPADAKTETGSEEIGNLNEPEILSSAWVGSKNHEMETLEILGYAEEGLKNFAAAEAYADRMLTKDPQAARALNLKGILAYRKKDLNSAEKFFEQSIVSDPGAGEPYSNLATVKLAAANEKEALKLFEKGFILSPTDFDVATHYHVFIGGSGDYQRAEKVASQAAGLYPNNRKIAYMLIDFLLKQGKYAEAMGKIEEAIVKFGIEDGILTAAIQVRKKQGPMPIKPSKRKATVSCCMIIKDEEKYLARCLSSIKPIVDEMIVVDTGSNDRSKDIATAFGAKVYDFKWQNDFARARNFSLEKASGDWILIMDGDEMISPLDYEHFKQIVKNRPKVPVAYTIVTRNYSALANIVGWVPNDGKYVNEQAAAGWIPSVKTRLFYGKDQIWFEGAVHELVDPVVKRKGFETKQCSIPVHHYGRLDKQRLTRKGEVYFEIGEKKMREMEGDINAVREMAIQATTLEKNEMAIKLWQKLISLDPPESMIADAYINMATLYNRLSDFEKALLVAKKAVAVAPHIKESLYNYALAELHLGNAQATIEVLKELVGRLPDYPPAQFILSASYFCLGEKEKGLEIIRKLQATALGPNLFYPVFELAETLIKAQQHEYALLLLGAAIDCDIFNKQILELFNKCIHMKENNKNSLEHTYPLSLVQQSINFENLPQ